MTVSPKDDADPGCADDDEDGALQILLTGDQMSALIARMSAGQAEVDLWKDDPAFPGGTLRWWDGVMPGESPKLRKADAKGGYTLAEHVGKKAPELHARLAELSTSRLASSFTTEKIAAKATGEVMRFHSQVIEKWLVEPGRRRPLTIALDLGKKIGGGVTRSTGCYQPMSAAIVVLIGEEYREMPFYMLVAMPVENDIRFHTLPRTSLDNLFRSGFRLLGKFNRTSRR